MQNLWKISQQTLWQILGKAVTSISTFIILGLVARNYGPNGTGVFTLALTYLAIFYLLADFGFNAHVLKKVTGYRLQPACRQGRVTAEWQKLLGTRILWSAALAILAIGLLPFWPFGGLEFNQAVLMGSLAIVASAVFVTCNLIFQSKLRYDLSVIASSIGTLVGLAATVWLVTIGQPIAWLLATHLTGWIAISFCALILIRKFFSGIIPLFNKPYTIDLFKQSWPLAATLSLNVLYFRADAFLIAHFKSVSDAGIYNIAYAFFQTALVLPTFIMNSYYPLMLQSLARVRLAGLGLLGVSLLGTVFTLIFAPFLIRLLTGSGFDGAVESLRILSLGFPAYFLSSLLMWVLIAKGRYKLTFLLYTSGTIFNILLNLIYIPKYSYFAASWITVISEYFILLLQIAVLLILDKQKRHVYTC